MDNIYLSLKNIFSNNNINIENIDNNISMIENGIIDSMTFVNILLTIEEEFNTEIDFENIELQSISSINGLIKYIKENT